MNDLDSLILAYCSDRASSSSPLSSLSPLIGIIQDQLRDLKDEHWMKGYLTKTTFTPMDCLNILAHFSSKGTREKTQKWLRRFKSIPTFPTVENFIKGLYENLDNNLERTVVSPKSISSSVKI